MLRYDIGAFKIYNSSGNPGAPSEPQFLKGASSDPPRGAVAGPRYEGELEMGRAVSTALGIGLFRALFCRALLESGRGHLPSEALHLRSPFDCQAGVIGERLTLDHVRPHESVISSICTQIHMLNNPLVPFVHMEDPADPGTFPLSTAMPTFIDVIALV